MKKISQNCFVFDLANLEIEEVSQNCFVFDVVNFQELRKSHRIAAFLTLSSSKIEEVSQNGFVFKPADRQIDGSKTTATTTSTTTPTLHYTTLITAHTLQLHLHDNYKDNYYH